MDSNAPLAACIFPAHHAPRASNAVLEHAVVATVLLGITVGLEIAAGAFSASFGFDADSHYVSGLMVHDYLGLCRKFSNYGGAVTAVDAGLPRKRIELLRWAQLAPHPQLTFADHVHELDTGKGHSS
jgi:hypothetical protein